MRPQKTDAVFQLSLTELAFILIFVVLLLIGSKFVVIAKEQAACHKQRDECYAQLPKVLANPEAAVTELANVPKLRAENAELQTALEKAQKELQALEALKNDIPNAEDVVRWKKFAKGYEKSTGKSVPLDEAEKAGENAGILGKDLANCQGQLTHCVRVTGAARGYGKPPCWTNPDGEIEYMFEVFIRSDGVRVEKAWPARRSSEAEQIPAIQATVAAREMTLPQFKELTAPIFQASKAASPECRHYVILRRDASVRDIDRFNMIRLGVEDYFYKNDRTGIATR